MRGDQIYNIWKGQTNWNKKRFAVFWTTRGRASKENEL